MEEASETKLWTVIRNFFSGRTETNPVEKIISEARENAELAPDVAKVLQNVLHLDQKQIMEIMVPRTDIDCVEEGLSIQEVAQMIISSGHSRLPVYRDNKDHIVGIVHAKDLLKALLSQENNQLTLRDLMRSPLLIPETKNVKSMLLDFQSKKVHLAIAVDEYGGTAGLITLEDVLEEIVGEIEDEYDNPKPADIKVLGDESCLVSGRAQLEDLRQELDISLHSDHVETIGGYLTEKAGRVPQQGETFQVGELTFQVKDADNKQVLEIVVYPVPACTKAELPDS